VNRSADRRLFARLPSAIVGRLHDQLQTRDGVIDPDLATYRATGRGRVKSARVVMTVEAADIGEAVAMGLAALRVALG
jgi:hypothetical protein